MNVPLLSHHIRVTPLIGAAQRAREAHGLSKVNNPVSPGRATSRLLLTVQYGYSTGRWVRWWGRATLSRSIKSRKGGGSPRRPIQARALRHRPTCRARGASACSWRTALTPTGRWGVWLEAVGFGRSPGNTVIFIFARVVIAPGEATGTCQPQPGSAKYSYFPYSHLLYL